MSRTELIAVTRFAKIVKNGNTAVKSIVKDGVLPPHNPIMEISILEKLSNDDKNDNVIELLDHTNDDFYNLVFKYYPFTLKQLLVSNYRTVANPYYDLDNSRGNTNYYKSRFNSNKYAFDFYKQIINGLTYIHSNGIIHRDIKLDNILVEELHDENYNLVITDFSISYDIASENNGGELSNEKITDVSTSIYKAPELLFSVRNYTDKVDVWAAFIILSQLLVDPTAKVRNQKNIPAIITDGSFSDGDNDGFGEEVGSDIKLLFSIFDRFGIPSVAQWPEVINHGTSDAFVGMFGESGNSNYILDKDKVEIEQIFVQLIPGLQSISNDKQRSTLIQCCVGTVPFESTIRWSSQKLLTALNSLS